MDICLPHVASTASALACCFDSDGSAPRVAPARPLAILHLERALTLRTGPNLVGVFGNPVDENPTGIMQAAFACRGPELALQPCRVAAALPAAVAGRA